MFAEAGNKRYEREGRLSSAAVLLRKSDDDPARQHQYTKLRSVVMSLFQAPGVSESQFSYKNMRSRLSKLSVTVRLIFFHF